MAVVKKFIEFPSAKEFLKSPYELDDIRRKISGIIENKIGMDKGQLALLELILCLSNEIAVLKEKDNGEKVDNSCEANVQNIPGIITDIKLRTNKFKTIKNKCRRLIDEFCMIHEHSPSAILMHPNDLNDLKTELLRDGHIHSILGRLIFEGVETIASEQVKIGNPICFSLKNLQKSNAI